MVNDLRCSNNWKKRFMSTFIITTMSAFRGN